MASSSESDKSSNFLRQFRDFRTREFKLLSAQQFMEVWNHYDTDGNGFIEGSELDSFLTQLVTSINTQDTGPEVWLCQKMWISVLFALIVFSNCIQSSLQPDRKCKGCIVGIIKETKILPRNEFELMELTKNLSCQCKCSSGGEPTYLHYAPSSSTNETYIVCDYKQRVFGQCLEYNEGGKILQPNNDEDCTKHKRSPCKSPYWSTDNYLNFECFEKYGGLLTPIQEVKQIQTLKDNFAKLQNTSSQQIQTEKDNFAKLQNTSSQQIQTEKDNFAKLQNTSSQQIQTEKDNFAKLQNTSSQQIQTLKDNFAKLQNTSSQQIQTEKDNFAKLQNTSSQQIQTEKDNFAKLQNTSSQQIQTEKVKNVILSILLALSFIISIFIGCFCYWRPCKTKGSYSPAETSLSSDKSSNELLNIGATSKESDVPLLQNQPKLDDEQATSTSITVSEETCLSQNTNLDEAFYSLDRKKSPVRSEHLQATFDKQNISSGSTRRQQRLDI